MSTNIFSTINNSSLRKQLEFVVEIDKLKQIFRRNLIIDGSRRENDAEHSWHLALMAILLQEHAKNKDFSLEKVMKMVIVHDLVEVYAGDTFAYDVAGNEDKNAREMAAAEKLFSMLPKNQGDEIRKLWEEFDEEKTPDSRYAAALDHLQPFIHNALTDGHTWRSGNVTKEQIYQRMKVVMDELPELRPWMEEQIQYGLSKGWIC